MHMHVHTCIYMSTRVFGVNKRPQHVFLESINDLNACFGANKQPQHTFLEPMGRPQALPSAPKRCQGIPSTSQGTPRDPKAILQQKQPS